MKIEWPVLINGKCRLVSVETAASRKEMNAAALRKAIEMGYLDVQTYYPEE